MSNLDTIEPASPPFSVVVIDDDPRLRTRLAMQLGEQTSAATFPNLAAMVGKTSPGPTVLVFGPSFTTAAGLKEMGEYLRDRPGQTAILVAEELSTALLQQAIRAGVADVITVPDDAGPLIEAVSRAAEHLNVSVPAAVSAGPSAGGAPRGKVITVFSTKGGSGKSFVATNLGVLLARRTGEPVCLVDADLQFGDAAVMLKLVPQHTIADAVGAINRLDSALLRSLLVRHDQSGLLVLPAPTEPAFADQIGADDVVKIIDLIRTFCRYVVVDTPAYFTEVVIRLLEECDDIVLVAGMDVPNIKNVKLGLNTLRLLNLPQSKVKLVLNRANSKVKIDVTEVERALGLKADTLVPSEITVPQSINKGVPAVIDAPKSGVARSLEALASLLLETDSTAGRSRR